MEGSRVKTLGPRQRKIQLLHNCLQGNHWLRSREVAVGEVFPRICCCRNPWLFFFLSPPCSSPDWKILALVWLLPWIILQQTPSIVTLFLLIQLAMIKQKRKANFLKNRKGKMKYQLNLTLETVQCPSFQLYAIQLAIWKDTVRLQQHGGRTQGIAGFLDSL